MEISIRQLTNAVENLTEAFPKQLSGQRLTNVSRDSVSPYDSESELPRHKERGSTLGLRLEHSVPPSDGQNETLMFSTKSNETAALTSSFNELAFDDDVAKSVRRIRRSNEAFFIPGRSRGTEYINGRMSFKNCKENGSSVDSLVQFSWITSTVARQSCDVRSLPLPKRFCTSQLPLRIEGGWLCSTASCLHTMLCTKATTLRSHGDSAGTLGSRWMKVASS